MHPFIPYKPCCFFYFFSGHITLVFIKMSGTIKEERYEIAIEDNGAGLAEEELDKVTEPFYMVQTDLSFRKNRSDFY